ncbi:MAG: EamA family transporter [Bryobacteraceae bacterium]
MSGPSAARNHHLGVLFAALAALGFAGKAIFIRLAYAKVSLCSTALPIYLLVEALRRVGPGTVSIVSSVGPILTILLGAGFLGDR